MLHVLFDYPLHSVESLEERKQVQTFANYQVFRDEFLTDLDVAFEASSDSLDALTVSISSVATLTVVLQGWFIGGIQVDELGISSKFLEQC